MTSKSVLQIYIDNSSLVNNVVAITKEAINNIPAGLQEIEMDFDKFEKYLLDFFRKHDGISKIIEQISCIADEVFIEAFRIIDSLFPEFPLEEYSQENKISSNMVVLQLPKDTLASFWNRITVNSVFEFVKSIFIITRTNAVAEMSLKEIRFFTDYILSIFDRPDISRIQRFMTISASFYARAISGLSLYHTNYVIDVVMNKSSTISNMNTNVASSYFLLFSEVVFKHHMPEFRDVENIMNDIIRFVKKKNPSFLCNENMFKYLTNMIGQILIVNDRLYNSEFMLKLNNYVKSFIKVRGYHGEAHKFHALLYNFSTHKKMNHTCDEYCKKYAENMLSKPDTSHSGLEQYTVFLNGLNYAQPRNIDDGSNFEWNFYDSKKARPEFIPYTMNVIMKNAKNFRNSQKELSQFIVQILIATKKKEYFVEFLNSEFSKPNIAAVSSALLTLLNFSNSPEFSRENILKESKFFVTSSIDYLAEKSVINKWHAFNWQSGLSLYKEHGSDVDKLLENIMELSHPEKFNPQPSKVLSIQLKRWLKVLNIDPKKKFFTPCDAQMTFSTNDGDVDEGLLNLVSLCGQIAYDDSLLVILVKAIFGGSPRNSIEAILVLEALAIKHKKYSEVIEQLFLYISTCPYISTLVLYIIQKTIYQVIELAVYDGYKFSSSAINNLNYALILGFCSASYVTRNLTYNLCELCLSANIKTIYEAINEEKESLNQKVLITIQRAINPVLPIDLPEITMMDVIGSEYGMFWMFYVAQFGHIIQKETTIEFRQGFNLLFDVLIKTGLADVKGQLLIKNSTVFIANSITSDIINKKNQSYLTLMLHRFSRASDDDSIMQHCALFSTFEFGSCTEILALNMKDPWSLYSITFATMLISSSSKFMEIEDELEYCEYLFNILDKVLEYLNSIEIITPDGLNESKLAEMPHISGLISNVLLTLKNICALYLKNHSGAVMGPFDRRVIVESDFFDQEKWANFAFILTKSSLTTLATDTLSDILDICKLPVHTIECYKAHPYLKTPSILSTILARNIDEMSTYIDESIHLVRKSTAPAYFKSICMIFNPFDRKDSWVEHIRKRGECDNTPKFSQEILKHTGSLLAISFAYMCNPEISKDDRIHAFTLFANVALGTLAMMNKVDDVIKILDKIDAFKATIRSRYPNLSSGAIRTMSELISKTHIHAGEQFVNTMFKCMIKWEKNATLGAVLDPWINSVNVSPRSQVLKTTDPFFHAFTPLSFIRMCASLPPTPSSFNIISKVVSSQEPFTQDILTVLLYAIIFDDCLVDLYTEKTAKLHAIFNTWPEKSGTFLTHVLGLEGYLFMERYQREEITDINYNIMINEILRNLGNVKNTPKNFKAVALSFILINIEEYAIEAGPFLLDIAPNFLNNEEYLSSLDGVVDKFGMESLRWGCCSTLQHAIRGIHFYSQVLEPLNHDVVMAITRAISTAANVVTTCDDQNTVSDALTYLECALDTVHKALCKLTDNNSLVDLFMLSLKLISCKNKDHPTISEKSIAILNELSIHQPTMIEVQELLDDKFEGFAKLFENVRFTEKSIQDFLSLMIRLVKYPTIAAKNIAQLILILIPLDELYPSEDRNFYEELAHSVGGNISKSIKKLASIKPQDGRVQHSEIVDWAVDVLSKEEIDTVITLFASIKAHAGNIRFYPVYQLCIFIVLAIRSTEGIKFELIAREASIDNEQDNVLIKNAFLQTINEKGVCIAEKEEDVSYFPQIEKIENNVMHYDTNDPSKFPSTLISGEFPIEKVPLEPFQSYESLIKQMDSSAPELLIKGRFKHEYNGKLFTEEFASKQI